MQNILPIVLYLSLRLYIASCNAHQSEALPLHTPQIMQWYCRAIGCRELAQGPYRVTVSDEARTRALHVIGRAL